MSALISKDGLYRYWLRRDILTYKHKGACTFIMLNPSTADHVKNDATIRKCLGFADRLQCSELRVVNLFAYRSTNPLVLKSLSREVAIGPLNNSHIKAQCQGAKRVICAWGNHGSLFGRSVEVLELLHRWRIKTDALRVTTQPWHPLYIPYETNLQPYGLTVNA